MADCDTIELQQLVYRYAAAVDSCDVDGFLSVFALDARLRSYHPDSEVPFADLTGHEQLATIPNSMCNIFQRTAHMVTNHLIEVDGDSATGSVLCTARHLSNDPEAPGALTVLLRYVDRYERHDGIWYIADREIRFLWSERNVVVDSGF